MKTIVLNRDRYFSLDQDDTTGKYYLAIPVCNSLIDYMEYYEIPKELIESYPENIENVEKFVYQCRIGNMFHLSLYGKAPNRGWPMWPKGEDPHDK